MPEHEPEPRSHACEVVSGVCHSECVNDDTSWRPFGIEKEEEVAEYDALHDDVPDWMRTGLWAWIKEAVAARYRSDSGRDSAMGPNVPLCERMAQVLQISFPNLRDTTYFTADGSAFSTAMAALVSAKKPLHSRLPPRQFEPS